MSSDENEACGCLLVLVLSIIGLIPLLKKAKEEEEKEKEKEKEKVKEVKNSLNNDINDIIYASIVQHFETLIEKERQSTYEDDYGNIINDGFENEFEYFIRKVIYKNFSYLKVEGYTTDIEKYNAFDLFFTRCMLIYEIVKRHSAHNEFLSDFTGIGGKIRKWMADNFIEFPHFSNSQPSVSLSSVMNGIDYENYIKNRIEEEGFLVKPTPVTGDQGVDLIVHTSSGKVAIQCKYYSSKVGNQAVQEVNAGKEFYNCSYAAVVSNKSYTPAAKKLAYSLGVYLCNENSLLSLLKEIDNNV